MLARNQLNLSMSLTGPKVNRLDRAALVWQGAALPVYDRHLYY